MWNRPETTIPEPHNPGTESEILNLNLLMSRSKVSSFLTEGFTLPIFSGSARLAYIRKELQTASGRAPLSQVR